MSTELFCDYCGRKLGGLEAASNLNNSPFLHVQTPIYGRPAIYNEMQGKNERICPRYITVQIKATKATGGNCDREKDFLCDSCCYLATMHECMRMLDFITSQGARKMDR